MKSQSEILRRKAKDGKEFILYVRETSCGGDFGWGFGDYVDCVFTTKKEAMKNARLNLKNEVEDYNDRH